MFPILVASLRVERAARSSVRTACGSALSLVLTCLAGAALADPSAPLSLDDAVQLAVTQAPALAAQQAAIRAAEAEAIRAPALPDPQLIAAVDSLPLGGDERFSLTRDSMTARRFGVMQEFPRKEKRRLRGERANAEVDAERARLSAQALDVRRLTAQAWIERHVAERERSELDALRAELAAQTRVAEAVFRGSGGSAADVLAAKAAEVLLMDRLDEVERLDAQARASLARWIGPRAAARPLAAAPDFASLPQAPAQLLEQSARHAALLPYAAMQEAAEADIALARAEKKPDWNLEVAYAQRGSAFSDMLSVEVRIDLPLFAAQRQDPAIAAKRAQLERILAEREDAERAHRADTASALAAWQGADKRVQRCENELLPLTGQRTRVALAAYGGGRGDIQPVLAARTAQIESRLACIDQWRQRARAWAELRYLLPEEGTP